MIDYTEKEKHFTTNKNMIKNFNYPKPKQKNGNYYKTNKK